MRKIKFCCWGLLTLLAFGLLWGCSSTVTPPTETLPTLHVIWVQCEAARTPEHADVMLDRVVQGGFDMLLYCVGSGVVAYRSDLLDSLPYVTSDYDPLAYVVAQGHARGVQVQAWWSPGQMMKYGTLRSVHPEWDIASLDEIPDDFHWPNFSLPEVRYFVGDVVAEITTNYQVDGVHLDYIRYPEPWPGSVGDYRETFSPDDVPFTVQEACQRLKAARAETLLTAAVMPGYREATDLQNWTFWLEGDYIDRVMPMAYVSPDKVAWLRDYFAEWHAKPHPERIVPGLSVVVDFDTEVLKTPGQLLVQIEMCQEEQFKSFAIFDETLISDDLLDTLSTVQDMP